MALTRDVVLTFQGGIVDTHLNGRNATAEINTIGTG